MFQLVVAMAMAAPVPIDDTSRSDLYDVAIPENAVEKVVDKFTRSGRLDEWRIYVVGGDVVAERFYFDNRKLAEEKLYQDYREKKLHGVWRQYHLNGILAAERPYRNGVMDGTFRFYDEDGDLIGESVIKAGTGVLHEFKNTALGVSDMVLSFKNSKKDGRQIKWGSFRSCRGVGVDMHDEAGGKIEGWDYIRDDDGLLLSSAHFKDGRLHGVVRAVDRSGRALSGYPKFYIRGDEVEESAYMDAARTDKLLKEILDHKPPKYAKVPEAPSVVVAKKKAAEKAKVEQKPH